MWKTAVKVNALFEEVVSISKIANNKENLTDNEKNWMQSLNIMAVNIMAAKKLDEWDVKMDKSHFENWLRERNIFKLFFDGASKGNPEREGGGGFSIDTGGKVEIEYY